MSRFTYGRYHEGPDPLAAPFDVAGAVDELGDAILDGDDPRSALRDLLRRGSDGRRGLDDLLRRARDRRRALQESGRLSGTLDEVRELLDHAVEQERNALFPDPSDDARFREAQLDALPSDTARAAQELSSYDWRSDEARQTFEQINELLRAEVLDAQFRGMKQALQSGDPQLMQRIKDMMSALNAMLAADARGEHRQEDFESFMEEYGDFFPDNPQNLEELCESLARRAAAAQRLLDSLTPEQRAELEQLMEEAFADDLDLQAQMSQLGDALRNARPDLFGSSPARMSGGRPMGLGEATSALEELSDLDALDEMLAQDYPGASIDDVDEELVRRALGRQAVDDLDALRRTERELERAGYLTRSGGELTLTPKAIRRIGQTALRRVFASLSSGRRGQHDLRDAGAAGEATGASRAWQFGDEQPLDVVRTVQNAIARRGTPRGPVRLAVDDFEVQETERRSRAAVCLLVDQSFSMVLNDTWRDAKTTALALHALASSQYPQDAIQVIGFANMARVVPTTELAALDVPGFQGTNLQHALMLAGRFLDQHPDAEPVVLVVTDGEPTAHLERDGEWTFSWPPSAQTLAVTMAEVDRMTRRGATLSIFRLGDDPRLESFVDAVARRNGGRVFAANSSRLGDYVVTDYLARRQGRRRSA
jgi:uncharacterized protein with von Willebrand factor type A (vWA) domain